jgi:predicted DNA-binding protein
MKTSINLPEEMKQRLERASQQTSNSHSAIIRMALHDYLRERGLWSLEKEVGSNAD